MANSAGVGDQLIQNEITFSERKRNGCSNGIAFMAFTISEAAEIFKNYIESICINGNYPAVSNIDESGKIVNTFHMIQDRSIKVPETVETSFFKKNSKDSGNIPFPQTPQDTSATSNLGHLVQLMQQIKQKRSSTAHNRQKPRNSTSEENLNLQRQNSNIHPNPKVHPVSQQQSNAMRNDTILNAILALNSNHYQSGALRRPIRSHPYNRQMRNSTNRTNMSPIEPNAKILAKDQTVLDQLQALAGILGNKNGGLVGGLAQLDFGKG
ncbi:hypothetical protein HK096_009892, partial [Nowakowskiella sp. JEL0078]